MMVARIPLCVQMRRVHGLNSSPASEAVAGREPTIKRDGEKRGYEHQAVILPATTVPCSVSNIGSCVPRLAWIVSFVPRREKKKAYAVCVCECVKWTHVTTSSSRVCVHSCCWLFNVKPFLSACALEQSIYIDFLSLEIGLEVASPVRALPVSGS